MPSNLEIINVEFQSHCWQLISTCSTPSLILCDFPSHIRNPDQNFKIFGLDDFPHFLSSALSSPTSYIYVITQQFSLLAKLFNPSKSIPCPFHIFTRTNFSISPEIKFIELHSTLPSSAWIKASRIYSVSNFQVTINGKRGPIPKKFDVFQLYISPSSESHDISAPIINSSITGVFHSTDFDLISQIAQNLSSIAIPYSNSNDLQTIVEPLSHVCTLHFEAPVSHDETSLLLEQIEQIISSSNHFLFGALTAGLHNLPHLSSLTFLSKKKVDYTAVLPLFTLFSLPFISLSVGLIFNAELQTIEELLLTAPQHNIIIPANFLTNIQTLSFSHNFDALIVSIVPFVTPRLTSLQIVRLTPGCHSDIFFTPEFLTLLQSRFYTKGGTQLDKIKESSGKILEVLAFTSNARFHTTPPDLELPVSFEYNKGKTL